MKNCKNCGKELNDDMRFCSYCGADNSEPKSKKLNFMEKRAIRENEKNELLAKSYIEPEKLDGLEEWDLEKISVKKICNVKEGLTKSLLWCIFAAIGIALSLGVFVILKFVDFDKSKKVVEILLVLASFLLFIIAAWCLSIILEKGYYYRMLNKMSKTNLAMKKVAYGQPPQIYYNGELYEVLTEGYCTKCELQQLTHIEEVEGKFVVVCNANREHLYLLNTQKVIDKFFPNKDLK